MSTRSLFRNTSLVSLMTFLSRILGLVRDMTVAYIFGAGVATDAFWVAFKIPNFMRRLFAEGAFSQAFVPVLAQVREEEGEEGVKNFIAHTSGSLATILLGITVLAVCASPMIIYVFAPGFHHSPERFHLASAMLKVTFPYLFFISLTAFYGAVQNSYDRFAIPAFTPVLLNICMITAAFYLTRYFQVPIEALAWGVLVAGVVQFAFQLPFIKRLRFLVWPRPNFRDPHVKKVLTLMLPALFGVSVAQINLLLDTVFASFLPSGSISWLYYSDRLMNFPLGVFGVAMATVVLPRLSREHRQQDDNQAYSATLDWSIRWILLIGVPASVALALLAGPLLTTLFQAGAFTPHDVVMATRSLLAFAFGVTSFMMIKVLASAFYARQDIRTPVRIGVIAMLTNMALNAILIVPLAHAGLALATSLAACVNAGLLMIGIVKRGYYQSHGRWSQFFLQLLLATTALALVLYFGAGNWHTWFAMTRLARVLQLSALVAAGTSVYFAVLYLAGFPLKTMLTRT